MPALERQLLSRRLDRLRQDHESRLLSMESAALQSIDFNRRVTVGTAFNRVRHDTQAALADYCKHIHDEVVSFVEQTTASLTADDIATAVACSTEDLDAACYLRRFDRFGEAVIRDFGRRGAAVDLSALSLKHTRALLHAGTADLITRFGSSLKDDLETQSRKQSTLLVMEKKRASFGAPWMSKWAFWIGLPVAAATFAQTYRAFVPAPTQSQSSERVDAAHPVGPASVAVTSSAASAASASSAAVGSVLPTVPRR